MSADNGIYILATSRKGKPVYRVAHVMAIDNFDYHENQSYEDLLKYMVDRWDNSARYTDGLEALTAANFMNRSCGYTEYGVNDIKRLNLTFPGD